MAPDTPVLERTLLRDVEAALDPLRRKQRDLQTFLASQFERLELQAGQMEQRERELADHATALAKERTSLDEEWVHFDQLVETARAHALEVRLERQRVDALLALQTDDGRRAELRRLQEAWDHAVHERDALEQELANAKRKLGELADVSVELAEARAELERLRSRSVGQSETPIEPHAAGPPNVTDDVRAATTATMDDMLNQLDAVRRDSIRHRLPQK